MEVPVAAPAVAEVHRQTAHEDRVNEMQDDKALSAPHHSMHLVGPVEVGLLKKKKVKRLISQVTSRLKLYQP
jgi:hypothetical protein